MIRRRQLLKAGLLGGGALLLPRRPEAQWWPWWNQNSGGILPPRIGGTSVNITIYGLSPDGSIGWGGFSNNSRTFAHNPTSAGWLHTADSTGPTPIGGSVAQCSRNGLIGVGISGTTPSTFQQIPLTLLQTYNAASTVLIFGANNDGSVLVGGGAGDGPEYWLSSSPGTKTRLPNANSNDFATCISDDSSTIYGRITTGSGGEGTGKWVGDPVHGYGFAGKITTGGGYSVATNSDGSVNAGYIGVPDTNSGWTYNGRALGGVLLNLPPSRINFSSINSSMATCLDSSGNVIGINYSAPSVPQPTLCASVFFNGPGQIFLPEPADCSYCFVNAVSGGPNAQGYYVVGGGYRLNATGALGYGIWWFVNPNRLV